MPSGDFSRQWGENIYAKCALEKDNIKKSTLEKGNTKCTGEKQYKKSILKKSNKKKSALEKGNKKKSPQVKSKKRKVHWRKAIYKSCAKHNLHISGLPHCWCWLSDRGK